MIKNWIVFKKNEVQRAQLCLKLFNQNQIDLIFSWCTYLYHISIEYVHPIANIMSRKWIMIGMEMGNTLYPIVMAGAIKKCFWSDPKFSLKLNPTEPVQNFITSEELVVFIWNTQ